MKKLIRTLQPVTIFSEHSPRASTIRQTTKDEYLPYTRIKLREKTRWFEVQLDNGRLGYIKKDREHVFKCSYVQLDDDEAHGFDYTLKENNELGFYEVFFSNIDALQNTNFPEYKSTKEVQLRRIKDLEKNKMHYVDLVYDPSVAEVQPISLKKKEKFYLTYEPEVLSKEIFIQIDNFNGKKGYLLKKTSYDLMSDKWMTYLSYVILTVCTIATFLACLAAGWLVIGFVLIIPGLIVGFLIMLVLQVVISILKGIFHEIYIRL